MRKGKEKVRKGKKRKSISTVMGADAWLYSIDQIISVRTSPRTFPTLHQLHQVRPARYTKYIQHVTFLVMRTGCISCTWGKDISSKPCQPGLAMRCTDKLDVLISSKVHPARTPCASSTCSTLHQVRPVHYQKRPLCSTKYTKCVQYTTLRTSRT